MSSGSGHPWLKVPAADYEGHMNSPEVGQLQFLSRLFGEFLHDNEPRTLAVAGCATGNGFEHLDPAKVERIIGIDINPEYLGITRSRYANMLPQLELICADVLTCNLEPSSLDFVYAGLVFEYLDLKRALIRFSEWLKPRGMLTVVLQLPCDHGKVTVTKYASVRCLEPALRLVDPDHLTQIAASLHINLLKSRIETLASGKQFFVGTYEREV